MTTPTSADAAPRPMAQRWAEHAMAACLGVMALAVFVNVVLRYGFGSGIAASEELSRLLFVWMVFIGAAVAYPLGEHMAFTSLVARWRDRPAVLRALGVLVRGLVLLACVLLGWGAWQQVQVGWGSASPVMGYPAALLALPALLCAVVIGAVAVWQLLRAEALDLGAGAEVE